MTRFEANITSYTDLTPTHLAPYETAMGLFMGNGQYILDRLKDGAQARRIPGYIGSGENKHSFISMCYESPFVFKVLHAGYNSGKSGTQPLPNNEVASTEYRMRQELAPLVAGAAMQGVHHERLLGAIPSLGIMATTLLKGTTAFDVKPSQIRAISENHLRDLAVTLSRLTDNALHPHNAKGILISPKDGFGFVDYTLQKDEPYRKHRSLSPARGIRSFLEVALDDHKAILAAEPPDWALNDPMFRGRYDRPKIKYDPRRLAARAAILDKIDKLGID